MYVLIIGTFKDKLGCNVQHEGHHGTITGTSAEPTHHHRADHCAVPVGAHTGDVVDPAAS